MLIIAGIQGMIQDFDNPPEGILSMKVPEAMAFDADIYFNDLAHKEAELIAVTSKLAKLSLLQSCFSDDPDCEEIVERATRKADDLVEEEKKLQFDYSLAQGRAKVFCMKYLVDFIDGQTFSMVDVTKADESKSWYVIQRRPVP